jgi:hypothetical protein
VVVVWRAILAMWQARQRRIDLAILWPQCLAGAKHIDHALVAFAVHCYNDPAWLALGEDELRHQINMLGVEAIHRQEELAR